MKLKIFHSFFPFSFWFLKKKTTTTAERVSMRRSRADPSARERGQLAGEYHSSDFSWEDLKSEVDIPSFVDAPEGRERLECYVQNQDESWEKFHNKVNTTAKFFKERRYILQEFPQLLSEDMKQVVEFGCGNGSTVIPLLKGNPATRVIAVDFSESAVSHTLEAVRQENLDLGRCEIFACDLSVSIEKEHRLWNLGCDAVLMMFMLSAVPPDLMQQSIRNAFGCLSPGGHVFFRDYGMYDLTQLRFPKDQRLGQKLYHRGDGTLSYFFTLEELRSKFEAEGFETVETDYVCVELYNRKKDFEMKRVFAHAVFRKPTTTAPT